jgi:hypothetical protein
MDHFYLSPSNRLRCLPRINQTPLNEEVICGLHAASMPPIGSQTHRMANGDVSKPSVFRSQTCDKPDPSGFFVAEAGFPGGIFINCSIHDIYVAQWFFGKGSHFLNSTPPE